MGKAGSPNTFRSHPPTDRDRAQGKALNITGLEADEFFLLRSGDRTGREPRPCLWLFCCFCAVLREPSRGRFDADRLSILHEASLVEDADDGVEARLV